MIAPVTVDINRLVDNGKTVVLFKNEMGSYTAFAVPNEQENIEEPSTSVPKVSAAVDGFTRLIPARETTSHTTHT